MKLKTLSIVLMFSVPLWAKDFFSNEFIKKELKEFESNTFKYMNSIPKKKNTTIKTYKYSDKIKSRKFLTRNESSEKAIFTPPQNNDRFENLIDTVNTVTNIFDMDRRKLTVGKVDRRPWSDDYWPIYKGILGNRYAIEEYEDIDKWDEASHFVIKHSVAQIYDSKDEDKINKLSPAEKYDLLIGQNFNLTRHGWAKGRIYFDRYQTIETWMGICHGWAAASYMLDRPSKKVTVKTYDGEMNITFYPTDIKALASLLWANTKSETRFVSGRCSDKNPEKDDNGRIKAYDCIDTNPATWHQALINQVGVSKRSFVMDSTYDYEVWNQPLISYKYKYFNPESKEPTDNINEAVIEYSNFKSDKFKNYRNKNVKKIVGIAIQASYAIETAPYQRDEDSEFYDYENTVYYQYDLELDISGNIIGGEWYQNMHPDFLWTPPKDTKALTYGDYYLLGQAYWSGKSPLSNQWREIANDIAQRNGAPLAKIVESLIELSNK